MPMNFTQLAALVDRAKAKPPPVVSVPPAQRAAPMRKVAPPSAPTASVNPPQRTVRPREVSPALSTARPTRSAPVKSTPKEPAAPAPVAAVPPPPAPEAEDFPEGWQLSRESWYFHRRFFRLFRRPMQRGEYSHLLYQIRHRRAELLAEGCWRVKLPDGKTLVVRGDRWRLANILPRDWQPPALAEVHARQVETSIA